MIGNSVVPGLPNILLTPSSDSTRRKASRPVMVLVTRASGIVGSSQVGRRLAYAMEDRALAQRIERLPCWQGRVALQPLKGGLSNISLLATDETGRYVVRCGGDIPVHHVFRARERAA